MNKVVTNQKKTIERDFPYTVEYLLKMILEEIGISTTKQDLIDFLYRHRIAKYQSGKKFGMICPIITPYDRFYNNEQDLSLYQTGAHCGMIITHKKGYLNCYPRFDEYTYNLVKDCYENYILSDTEDDEEDDDIPYECTLTGVPGHWCAECKKKYECF